MKLCLKQFSKETVVTTVRPTKESIQLNKAAHLYFQIYKRKRERKREKERKRDREKERKRERDRKREREKKRKTEREIDK